MSFSGDLNIWKVRVLLVSLFLIALPFDALYTGHCYWGPASCEIDGAYEGYYMLLVGALAIFDYCPAWYANVTFALALRLLERSPKLAMKLSILTVALALTTFLYDEPWDDGGATKYIMGYGPGFYIWLLAFVVCAFVCLRLPITSHPSSLRPKRASTGRP